MGNAFKYLALGLGLMSLVLVVRNVIRKRRLRRLLQAREARSIEQFIDESYEDSMEREIARKVLSILERHLGVDLAGISKDDVLATDLGMKDIMNDGRLMFVIALESEFDIALPASEALIGLRVGKLIELVAHRVRNRKSSLGSEFAAGEEKAIAPSPLEGEQAEEASSLLERAGEPEPGDYEAWLTRAQIATRGGDRLQAVEYCRKAVEAAPRSARANKQLGAAYRRAGRLAQASAAFRTALEITPDDVSAHEGLTATLLAMGAYRELVGACRAAIGVAPRHAGLRARLALALERSEEYEASREAAESALQLDSVNLLALLTLATLDKRAGALQAAQERLAAIDCTRLMPSQVATVKSELGDVLDRMGDYSAAYAAFQASNQSIMQNAGYEPPSYDTMIDTVARYQRVLTTSYLSSWRAEDLAEQVTSPIFLVGFPRAGVTLTEQIITAGGAIRSTHAQPLLPRLIANIPQVLGRDLRYPEDLGGLSDSELTALRSHYWKLAEQLVGATERKRLLDNHPFNLVEVALIYRLFPDAPIVVVVQDPRDYCLSCFMRLFVPDGSMIHFPTLEEAVRFYKVVMGFWLHARPLIQSPVYQVRCEDLLADLEGTMRPLLEFIDGTWNVEGLRMLQPPPDRGVSTASDNDVAQTMLSRTVGRWRHYLSQVGTTYSELEPFVKAFGY
jgi:tetratricopeptide (TPR) repeat protein